MPEFMLTTILSQSDHRGKVQVQLDGKVLTVMDADEARALALNFLECAEAAEQDAMVWAWARQELTLTENEAAGIVHGLRKYRGGVKN